MRLKNSKNNLERSVALFEIVLMVLSVLTISYLIGSKIELVSAEDALKIVADNVVNPTWQAPATPPTTTPTPNWDSTQTVTKLAERSAEVASESIPSIPSMSESTAAQQAYESAQRASKITPTSTINWGERFSSASKSIGGTATVASAIWATTFLLTAYAFGTSEGFAKELSWTLTYGFAAGQIVAIVAEFFGAGGALTTNLVTGIWGSFVSVTPAGLIALAVAAIYALFAY
ncbi:MAG: hypothetical protein WC979_10185, partial [Candidatus Pacearchaeota archaeon]